MVGKRATVPLTAAAAAVVGVTEASCWTMVAPTYIDVRSADAKVTEVVPGLGGRLPASVWTQAAVVVPPREQSMVMVLPGREMLVVLVCGG